MLQTTNQIKKHIQGKPKCPLQAKGSVYLGIVCHAFRVAPSRPRLKSGSSPFYVRPLASAATAVSAAGAGVENLVLPGSRMISEISVLFSERLES